MSDGSGSRIPISVLHDETSCYAYMRVAYGVIKLVRGTGNRFLYGDVRNCFALCVSKVYPKR